MEITVKCADRCDRVFSFTPKPGKEEAVSDLVDHHISQMLTLIIPEVDAKKDEKLHIYEYITASYRRELIRHASNASFQGAEGINWPVFELPAEQDESKSGRPHLPEAFQSGGGKRTIAMRPKCPRNIRASSHRHKFASEPLLLHGEQSPEDFKTGNPFSRAPASDPLPYPNLPSVISEAAYAAQFPEELDFSDYSTEMRPRPQRVHACELAPIRGNVVD